MTVNLRVRAQVFGIGAGHTMLFQTMWRPGTGGGSNADATDCVARVRACMSGLTAYLGTGVVYHFLTEVDGIEDTTGAITGSFTAASVADVTGSSTGDPYSPSAAYLIHARTSLIVGRRFLKGRTYLAQPTEGHVASGGVPDSLATTAITNAFNGMLTGGSTLSFPVIWHRPHPKGATNGTSGPVTSYACETGYLGVQRRRRF